MINFIKPWLLSYTVLFIFFVIKWEVREKGLCGLLLDDCFKKNDLRNIELSAELASFLMDHHFHLKVTDQPWLLRLGHVLDVFFTTHEVSFSLQAEQLVVFVLSPEV